MQRPTAHACKQGKFRRAAHASQYSPTSDLSPRTYARVRFSTSWWCNRSFSALGVGKPIKQQLLYDEAEGTLSGKYGCNSIKPSRLQLALAMLTYIRLGPPRRRLCVRTRAARRLPTQSLF